MSQENVEVLRSGFEAWNAGDMDALREVLDPDVIMRQPEGWPEPGPEVGREAVMHQWEQQRETWDADALEPTSDFIDAADRVVVRIIWRGAGHGPEANLEATGVFTVRKGRIVFLEWFWDHAEALETLGLPEQTMSGENMEIVHRWQAAMSASPEEAVAAVATFFDPNVDYYPVRKWPEAQPCHGMEEFSQFLARFQDGCNLSKTTCCREQRASDDAPDTKSRGLAGSACRKGA